jgi:uncharacterized protein (TIGR03067 family)
MLRRAAGLIIALASLARLMAQSPAPMSELVKKDYERLTGSFQLVSAVIDGKPLTEDVLKQTRLVTEMNKFTVSDSGIAGTSAAGTFTIDPTKNPKTADSKQATGPDKGKTLLGIYEMIDDNRKRACWAPAGKPRPTSFSSEPGTGHILQIWQRIK